MPRLGDDQNMATAYPNRVRRDLRGGWMKQLLVTAVGTFLLYKILFTDYKGATISAMTNTGLSGDAKESILPKTRWEKVEEAKKNAMTPKQKALDFGYQMGNLTYAVAELQQLLVESKEGVAIQYPISLPNPEEGEEGEKDAPKVDQNVGGGGDGEDNAREPPAMMLRGAAAASPPEDAGNPDGGEEEEGGGRTDGSRRVSAETAVGNGSGGAGARKLMARIVKDEEQENGGLASAASLETQRGLRQHQRQQRQQHGHHSNHREQGERVAASPEVGGEGSVRTATP